MIPCGYGVDGLGKVTTAQVRIAQVTITQVRTRAVEHTGKPTKGMRAKEGVRRVTGRPGQPRTGGGYRRKARFSPAIGLFLFIKGTHRWDAAGPKSQHLEGGEVGAKKDVQ